MWILESPIPILAVGGISLAIVAAALVHTGRRGFVLGLLLVPLVTAALFIVERVIVTPREEVESMLHELALDLESNDQAAILEHVSEISADLRSNATRILNRITVDKAVVKRNLNVTVHSDQQPPLAQARFNGVIVATEKHGTLTQQPYPRFFVVELRKENGRWRVRDYEDFPPNQQLASGLSATN